ncbi:hypothetical protein [Paenirhodobacter sp. CAU 1674]|jgi:hypothetical protein|uniref:hypothetical protein n=1 Tax=Paenirhodobacter sp. CAU 1674 TaxID=3032596 RepID=UPI0023DB8FF5|nr:hypothetical protein [Paenirhodobacter sp. CAU 1674]MDF2142900.1 hypothetical protein [Paenirhodobacter sp. CAU 1674]
MFTTTARSLLTGLVIATATAAPTLAEVMVRDVEVTTDLEALQNPAAAKHYAHLSDDLEHAIIAALDGKMGETGSKITIDINEVELANSFQSELGVADSHMDGDVGVTHDSDHSKFDAYTLSVSFADAGPFFAPGTDLSTIMSDSQEYYDAMIAAFADHVVQKLK